MIADYSNIGYLVISGAVAFITLGLALWLIVEETR